MKKVFVIMPFENESFEIFEAMKAHFADKFEFTHAATEENQRNILKDIIQAIYNSDVVIANLTGLKPNIMYELGIAHTMNKKTIIITDDIETLPFDLKNYRAQEYSTHFAKFKTFLSSIEKYLNGTINGSVKFSNPVADFLNVKDEGCNNKNNLENEIHSDFETGKKGYLDYVVEVEELSEKFSLEIAELVKNMENMTSVIEKSTKIQEAQSGNLTPKFVRSEAQKVGKSVFEFAEKLKTHNNNLSTIWGQIYNNTISLLDNPILREQEKSEFFEYKKSLENMQCVARENKIVIIQLQEALHGNNLKIEKNLMNAVEKLDFELGRYISIVEDIDFKAGKAIIKCDVIAHS